MLQSLTVPLYSDDSVHSSMNTHSEALCFPYEIILHLN